VSILTYLRLPHCTALMFYLLFSKIGVWCGVGGGEVVLDTVSKRSFSFLTPGSVVHKNQKKEPILPIF